MYCRTKSTVLHLVIIWLGGNFFLICRNWPDNLLSFARRGELSRDWGVYHPPHTPREFRPCLWHCRFGYLGMENISKLIDGNTVDGMKTTKDTVTETCESCVMGKQHRTAYPKEIAYRAVEPFEIVHSDVCGPVHVNSFGNLRYYVTFIDDYSRYTHVYFIKRKSEVLDKFKEFVSYATNTTGKKVKVLRSDNGGEYCSMAFQEYMKQHGIVHQTTVPYSPEQNGVAERMNRTLVETARSMMSHSKVPTNSGLKLLILLHMFVILAQPLH